MAIKHKFRSPVQDAADDGTEVGPNAWNDEHDVEGVLSEFLDQAAAPFSVLALDGNSEGVLIPYANLLAILGALALSGGTMTGDIGMATHKVTDLGAPTQPGDAATKAYVDAVATLVSGALTFKGSWDASVGTFPGAGAAKIGFFYKVSVAGTVNGKSFDIGDDVFAIVDNASTSTYAANWLKVEGSISLAEVQAAVGFTFGSAAALNAGTSVGDLVRVVTGGKLPALDASQLTNLPSTGVPAGSICFFPMSAAPAGYLKANGALLSRTTYAALYAAAAASGNIVAEASWASNKGAFSTGDLANNFRLPDLRGVFVRNWDDSAGLDSGRAIGSSQDDDFKAHVHSELAPTSGGNLGAIGDTPVGAATGSPTNTGSAGGTETRPKNVALLACIKY